MALVIVSFLSIFALQVLLHLQTVQIEIQQVDTAVQIARDVLNTLKHEQDWQIVAGPLETVRRFDTDFSPQLLPQGSSGEGLVDLELTIRWIGAPGLEQLVFNTTVSDLEAGG